MTDNEIIKALEYCSETNGCICCEYVPTEYGKGTVGCATELMKDALDLIQRQQNEIAKWRKRFNQQVDAANETIQRSKEREQAMKNQSIKEFADKLEANIGDEDFYVQDKLLLMSMIDNLVKEMGCGE